MTAEEMYKEMMVRIFFYMATKMAIALRSDDVDGSSRGGGCGKWMIDVGPFWYTHSIYLYTIYDCIELCILRQLNM